MRWEQKVEFDSRSHVGFRRQNNEDAHVVVLSPDAETFQARGHLFVVADGMGGHAVGELASKTAVDTIPHHFFKNRQGDIPAALTAAIVEANSVIHEKGSQNIDFNRMGTTCVALVLGPKGAVVGHVGDSRLYRIRRDQIDLLTFDHSLEWEMQRKGHKTTDLPFLRDIKHVITRSIGPEDEVDPEVDGPFPVYAGDIFVLCSDGLSGPVTDAEIGAIAKHLRPSEACQLLVNLANARGGVDNVTVIIVHVGPLPEGVPPNSDEAPPPEFEEDNYCWLWMGGMWVSAVICAVGIMFAMLNTAQRTRGIVLSVLSLVIFVVTLLFWRRTGTVAQEEVSVQGSTVLSRAYRTAPTKLTPTFLGMLKGLVEELQKNAAKENWPIDATAHETASAAAKTSMDQKQPQTALTHFAKALDVLMAGWQKHLQSVAEQAAAAKSAAAQTKPAEGSAGSV
jgi:protein phosphatase